MIKTAAIIGVPVVVFFVFLMMFKSLKIAVIASIWALVTMEFVTGASIIKMLVLVAIAIVISVILGRKD